MPGDGLYIQLTWDTPGDPDQSDNEGSDVDLHLRHPTGNDWGVAPQDCYYANPMPDWGAAGDANNPRPVLDDVDGAGPEAMALPQPELTAPFGTGYAVGVHYFRSENQFGGGDWGPSDVTVEIFLDGEPVADLRHAGMVQNDLWQPFIIHWSEDGIRVEEVDELTPDWMMGGGM